jgi:L-2-hydroxyglutarate oxidase LhgO
MYTRSYNVAVIGGGIIGCALARECGKRFSKVLLIEKETSVGFHTSGRNSGVVHSGFNPKPGTLNAKLCVEGSQEIRQYCKEQHIPCEQVGTYVVAVEEVHIPVLYELKSRGEKNGVPGIEILSMEMAREHEPNVKGIAAMFSPTGAIVDSQALTRSLADDARQLGITMAMGQEVMRIAEKANAVELSTQSNVYTAELVINCAGLHADRLAHMMGVGKDYVIAPFRGEYFVMNRSGPPLIRSMVYPIPNPHVPFLGVHLTRTIAGSVMIGPNAVPAFGREAYRRTAVNMKDLVEIARHRGFWNAFVRNRALVKIAWNELRHSCSKRHFLKEANRLVTGLRREDLTLGSRVGIRSQLIKSDGQLVEDLVVETTPRSIHILNVVSPGMTSAIAFAKWLSRGIDEGLQWVGNMGEV